MKLEEIGFYTLSDSRALNTSDTASLTSCELKKKKEKKDG